MPEATISSTVKVQEQTFQAFLNWLRIAPDFLWHSSPGRNAEGNLHTLPEVSLQEARSRFKMSMEVNVECSRLFSTVSDLCFFHRKCTRQEITHTVTLFLAELRWGETHIFRLPDQSWNLEKECAQSVGVQTFMQIINGTVSDSGERLLILELNTPKNVPLLLCVFRSSSPQIHGALPSEWPKEKNNDGSAVDVTSIPLTRDH